VNPCAARRISRIVVALGLRLPGCAGYAADGHARDDGEIARYSRGVAVVARDRVCQTLGAP
jgi:hypothetical protein